MSISSQRLRSILQDALDRLSEIDDGGEESVPIAMVSNTYFLGDCSAFLGVSGYNGGYVNLDRINLEGEEEEGD